MLDKIVKVLESKNPLLKKKLRIARMRETPAEIIKKSFKNAIMMALTIMILAFFYIDSQGHNKALLPVIFVIALYAFYRYSLLGIDAKILARRKEIDRDVLFAGRYLLVKLNSGQPLINALIDASKSYGTASKYFKDIVKDIELGRSIEDALAYESEYSPSDKFRKILFQISNAIRIGIDVTEFLEATLTDIANDQIIEIQRYGKKLNSLTLFYMLLAVVVPSLGMTIFIIIFSLSGIDIDYVFFGVILFFLTLLQGMFLVIYRSIRPNINI